MKKLLFLFLVIPFLFAASPLQQKHLAVIAALNSTESVSPLFSSDYEDWVPTSVLDGWTSENSIVAGNKTETSYSGTYAFVSIDNADYLVKTISGVGEWWLDFWVRKDNNAANAQAIRFYDTGNTSFLALGVDGDGDILLNDSATGNSGDAARISADTWYHVFIHITSGDGGSDDWELAVNQAASFDSWDVDVSTATTTVTSFVNLRAGLPYSQTGTSRALFIDAKA